MTGQVVEARGAGVAALLGAVRRTAAQHSLFVQALAAQLGIGSTDLDCLLLLHDLGPASAGQLADVLGLTTGAVTGVVDRLAAAGFVVRENDPSDRRRVIVQPVPEQARRLEALFAPVVGGLADALEPLSDVALGQLVEFERRAADVLEAATSRLRAQQAGSGGVASFSAPLLEVASASLEFASGAANVRIGALEVDADGLYRATFSGTQPNLRVQGSTVQVRYKRMGPFEWGTLKHTGSVSLNPHVAWAIVLRGGAAGVSLDLRGLELRGVTIEGGANKVELVLPEPRGEVTLSVEGGANRVEVRRPQRAPALLQVQGGANRLEFDAQRFGAIGGDVRLASAGWELASDRYVIEVRGGASRLSVQEL